MKLKVLIKSRVSDRFLAPLRDELVALIDQSASLLEIGCATGDLIFRAASKISHGYGIDLDCDMIDFAEKRRQESGLNHLRFDCVDALTMNAAKYNITTSTLCLHVIGEKDASNLLEMMVNYSDKVLIADYRKPTSLSGKIGIEFDEAISGHYRCFRKYRKFGGIPAYVRKISSEIEQEIESSIDGISIWVIKGKARTQS